MMPLGAPNKVSIVCLMGFDKNKFFLRLRRPINELQLIYFSGRRGPSQDMSELKLTKIRLFKAVNSNEATETTASGKNFKIRNSKNEELGRFQE